MDVDLAKAHSTLEVVPHQPLYQRDPQGKPQPTDLGKQVAPYEGKQVALDDGKQHTVNDDGLESVPKKESFAHRYGDHPVQVHRPSRKRRKLLGGAIGLIIILALVLGVVFGLKHKHSARTSLTSPSNSSSEPLSTPLPAPPPASPTQHNIAALSFASKSVNNTRVYFQDNMGQIMEAANSADNMTWNISRTGITGKNGSAIAAAVSRPGFPFVSHVFSIQNAVYRYLFRSSVYSIWTLTILSTKSPPLLQQVIGLRGLYHVKAIPQCQTPA